MPEDPDQPGEGAQTTAAQRLRAALLRPSRTQVVAAVLLAALGFTAVTQLRVAGTDDTLAGKREEELVDLLSALGATRQRTEAEVQRLEGVAANLRDDRTKRQTALDQAEGEVDALSIVAGLVPVTGPGIRITITEQDGRVGLAAMLDTIEELRTVNAEAIAINGKVRVVAQTSFTETAGGFRVDGQQLEAPYVIDVIGDPDVLSSAIEFKLGPRQQIEDDGGRLEVRKLQAVDIEAVSTTDEPSFAVPEEGQ